MQAEFIVRLSWFLVFVSACSQESAPLYDQEPWKWFLAQSTHSLFNPLNTCISEQHNISHSECFLGWQYERRVKNNWKGWWTGQGADEVREPRARWRLEKKTGLSWVRLGQRQSMSKRGEERRTEQEHGGKQRQMGRGGSTGERGSRVSSMGVWLYPIVPLAAFFIALCLESHFISFMTSSPDFVHASVPCFASTVCLSFCLCRVMVGTLGIGVCVCVCVSEFYLSRSCRKASP